jgi:adenosylcobyric acid synthase
LDVEDSLALDALGPRGAVGAEGPDVLRIAVIRTPRISNLTDFDPLGAEPGVTVSFVDHPADLRDAHLVVLPGTKATAHDLDWMRTRGLVAAVTAHAAAGRPVLGICGGYQMLARSISDDVESLVGTVPGLGLLPADVRFAPTKTVGRVSGQAYGHPVSGYEIHHGMVDVDPDAEPFLDGCRQGSVWGATWHGAFESDEFRRAFLVEVAATAGASWRPGPPVSFAAVRETRLDALGDLVADHLDTDAVRDLIIGGIPSKLPVLRTTLDAPD